MPVTKKPSKKASTRPNGAPVTTPAEVPPAGAPSSQLHSYQKVILRPGSYRVPARANSTGAFQDESGKWVREETFDTERLNRLAGIAADMNSSGFKIPAPFAHRDKSRKYPFPVKNAEDGGLLDAIHNKPIAWDASLNGGYWRDLQYVEDVSQVNSEFKPGPGLIGVVDTFGDPNDLNTPAGKVSRTVQETSICVLPNYKPPMATEAYPDYIAHIAMPVHAIEPGQDNFSPVVMSEDDIELFSVSMSDLVTSPGGAEAEEQGDPELTEVLGLLSQLKIVLPSDTNRDNLLSTLRITLSQKIADQKEMNSGNPLTNPPAGSTSKPAPIAMSDNLTNALLKRETKRKQDELKRRLNRLRNSGSHELAPELVTELENEINAVSMSADDINDDGDFPVSTIEKQIALLERTGRPMTGSLVDDDGLFAMSAPNGSIVHEPPKTTEEDLDEAYVNGICDRAGL